MRVGPLGFDRNALPHPRRVHPAADGGDGSGCLMAQDHRGLHDEVADPAFLEVMHIRTAYAHRGNTDQDLISFQGGYGPVFDHH
jgi:hypothetical protein